MTCALLATLPKPAPNARILDACCGSGTIAAALHARGVGVRLHVLDADALAIVAARANVPSAKRFLLCDGWPHTDSAFAKTGKPAKYDAVVSNRAIHI
jgi:16S rRNA G1207 methylase RsmC